MTYYTPPTDPGDDVLDSRDLVARQQELELLFDFDYELFAGPGDFEEHIRNHPDGGDDDALEYAMIYAVNQEGADTFGGGDWDGGIILVSDDYFVEYAEQVASDIGAVSDEHTWPTSYIDWEAAAAALQMDYATVEYDGVIYWARA